ncbi:DUF3710 domain-containing protein [Rhodococcus erythropolis]|uniref:DUF3710 domain-containing protein n=1 Tax=Rhodococcus erythropolis TaxID=1833 RepID=UPI00294A5975|nr:DUF3710 domain-containing protein [Rhodococcus erythropolis]MDV6278063.1 DUF3710 domain-containing protein [Rhodococcus erythropolis]
MLFRRRTSTDTEPNRDGDIEHAVNATAGGVDVGGVESCSGGGVEGGGPVGGGGPVDVEDLGPGSDPAVGVSGRRVNFGSILLPIPEQVQVQVQTGPDGIPPMVSLVTDDPGRIAVEVFAAPRMSGQWSQVADALAESLRNDGATVRVETGPWGEEVAAAGPDADLRFIGVDGTRWMVRCVIAGPPGAGTAESPLVATARTILSDTVINRGTEPYPVGALLPMVLPEAIAAQIAAAHQQRHLNESPEPAEHP